MKKITFLILSLFFAINLFSQDKEQIYKATHDPQAKKILDALSKKYDQHNTARFYFKYTLYNAQDSSKQEYKGYLFVKDKTKYKIFIPGQEIFSDGVKTYTYNKKANEINITFIDPNSDAVYTPQKMLNFYKKGFKYSYRGIATFEANVRKDGKISKQTKSCNVIDLYPEKPKSVPYSIIRIWIDKDKNELISVKYQLKSGIEQVVEILQTDFDIVINDNIFKFDKSKYPKDIDIIDFTED